jgi:virginiamycin B lyase
MTNLVVNQVEVSGQPESVATGEGSVWALCRKEGKVERIDPKTNKVIKTIELSVPGAGGEIAVGEGSVWVTMTGFPLARISPLAEKEKVVQQFHGAGGGAVTTSLGAVWLVNAKEGTIWKIDPKRVAATLAE